MCCEQATPPEEGAAQVQCRRCSEDHKGKGSNSGEAAVCDSSSKDQDERPNGAVHHVTATQKPSDAASVSTGPDDGAPLPHPSCTCMLPASLHGLPALP